MAPRKRKCGDLIPVVKEADDEFCNDVRLARRWKRRRIANQNFRLNSKGNNSTGRCRTALKEVPDCNFIQIYSDSDSGDRHDLVEYDKTTKMFVCDGNRSPVEVKDMDTRSVDDGAVYISSAGGTISDAETVGHNGNVTAAENVAADDAFAENVDVVDQSPNDNSFGVGILENNNGMDSRSGDNGIVGDDESLKNGIVDNDVVDNGNNVNAKSVDGDDDNDTENAGNNHSFDDVDSDYKMFSDNLIEDGKSYFLEVPVIHGISEIVRYESEDGQCDGCIIPDSKKTREIHERESLNNDRVLRSASKTMVMDNEYDDGRDLVDVDYMKIFGECFNAPSTTLRSDRAPIGCPKEGVLTDVHPKNLTEPDNIMKSPLEINHGQTDDHKKDREHMDFDFGQLFNSFTPGLPVNGLATSADNDIVFTGSIKIGNSSDVFVRDGNRHASPVEVGDMHTRSVDGSAVYVSSAGGTVTGAETVGHNGNATAAENGTADVAFAENVEAVDQPPSDFFFGVGILENNNGMDARSGDKFIVDWSRENGIVGDDFVDNGNNVHESSVDGDDDNDTENAGHNCSFDDADPDYKMFLENLKEDGKSYFLEVPVLDGILEIVRYESEDEQWDGCIAEDSKGTRDFLERESLNNERVLRSASKRQRMETGSHLRDGMETQGNLRDMSGRGRKSLRDEKTVKKKVVGGIFCTSNGHSSNKPSLKTLSSTKCCDKNFNMVDERYEKFVNSLKIEGRNIVFQPEHGRKVVYEEDEQSSSDSEVVELDVNSFSGGVQTPFVTAKDSIVEDSEGLLKSSGRNNCSQFREGLMEILRRPFDEKEHRDLLNKVTCRRELKGERETRSGKIREYLTGILGKSYLELHCDLEEKILSAKTDPAKELNILRGFFYWLQNVAHKGAFQPWRDSSYLEVLPQ